MRQVAGRRRGSRDDAHADGRSGSEAWSAAGDALARVAARISRCRRRGDGGPGRRPRPGQTRPAHGQVPLGHDRLKQASVRLEQGAASREVRGACLPGRHPCDREDRPRQALVALRRPAPQERRAHLEGPGPQLRRRRVLEREPQVQGRARDRRHLRRRQGRLHPAERRPGLRGRGDARTDRRPGRPDPGRPLGRGLDQLHRLLDRHRGAGHRAGDGSGEHDGDRRADHRGPALRGRSRLHL